MTTIKQQALEAGLIRAAESLGDVTAPVMAEFYARFPDARASFVHHAPTNQASLEAEMVGNVLYYLMNWFESPIEARIAFDSSVPHHRVALGVPPDWYRGLIESFIAVVEPAAAPQGEDEQRVWREVSEALVELVERNRFQ